MNTVIKQKFEVLGQYFDTQEEAETYLAENEDKARVDAFIQYLRDQGAQRINSTIPEALLKFIKFEKGELEPANKEPETSEPVPEEEPVEQKSESSEVSPSVFDQVEEDESQTESEAEPEEEVAGAVVEQAKATSTRKSLFAT